MIPALCAGLQMVIFGWGLSITAPAVWKPLLSRPPVESCVNGGLDSMVEASAVNYRMFVAFEVWPTGFAQPLCTHRVLGHLCSYSPISLHGRRLHTLLKLIAVIVSGKSEGKGRKIENELTDM